MFHEWASFFPPFWGKYRKMRYLWNFRTCSLMQNTKTTRNNILLETVRFNFVLSQNCILIAIHHYAPLLYTLYMSESLTMAIKVQGVAGGRHTFQNTSVFRNVLLQKRLDSCSLLISSLPGPSANTSRNLDTG